ncbi:MAG: hypothetical protein ACR2K9_01590 [Solirubrobacteraceae bacterium]
MRALAVLLLSVLAVALAGCGGTPNPEQAKRALFIKQEKKLNDDEMARLCPSLFPSDFLKEHKKYSYTVTKKPKKPSPADLKNAQAAGCTSTGTPPKAK